MDKYHAMRKAEADVQKALRTVGELIDALPTAKDEELSWAMIYRVERIAAQL